MTAQRHHVKIGEVCVAGSDDVLFTIGLGSCIAVMLYDPGVHIGGLAHVMLPEKTQHSTHPAPGRFASTAVVHLIEQMVAAGARKRGIFARIAGGAAMFKDVLPIEGVQLGERNAIAVRNALTHAGVPLRGEDVGGSFGRSVYFHMVDGSVVVRAVKRDDLIL